MCLYDISPFMLHFIFYFSYELCFYINLVIMTSPCYYDVTHFWSVYNETCTVAICKIENKNYFYSRRFTHFLHRFQFINEFCDIIKLRWRHAFFHLSQWNLHIIICKIVFSLCTFCSWEILWFRQKMTIRPKWSSRSRSPLIFWDTSPTAEK